MQMPTDFSRSNQDQCRPVVSKEIFTKALIMIQEQESIDEDFSNALQRVGSGHFVFGTENKYEQALLMVLKAAVHDQYDYIDWWLYEGAPDYEVWANDESKKWCLKNPGDLYDFITTECR